jgi:hypothetical protein
MAKKIDFFLCGMFFYTKQAKMTNVSIIESIDLFEYSKFDGFKISTSSGPINIKICNDTQCCEKWGISASLSGQELDDLCGATITNITYLNNERECYTEDDSPDTVRLNVIIEYSLNGVDDSFTIYLKNEHNGYYPHQCVLNWEVYIGGKLTTFATIKEI